MYTKIKNTHVAATIASRYTLPPPRRSPLARSPLPDPHTNLPTDTRVTPPRTSCLAAPTSNSAVHRAALCNDTYTGGTSTGTGTGMCTSIERDGRVFSAGHGAGQGFQGQVQRQVSLFRSQEGRVERPFGWLRVQEQRQSRNSGRAGAAANLE